MMESVAGSTIAAPAPWIPRIRMSAPELSASAAPTEAAPKTTMPTVKKRRRPNRSPIEPPNSSSPARISV